MPLFILGDGVFGRTNIITLRSPRLHLDKCQGGAIVSDQIDFAFHAPRSKVSRDHNVAVSPEIPIGVRLAANAGAPCLVPRCRRRRWRGRIRQAFSCGSVHQAEHCASQNRQWSFSPDLLCALRVLCVKSLARTRKKHLTHRAQSTQRKQHIGKSAPYADASTSLMHCSNVRTAKSACSSPIMSGGATRIVFSPAPRRSSPFSNARFTMASRRSPARSLVF